MTDTTYLDRLPRRPAGEHCPRHPHAKLTTLGCVMCSGEQNAARDRVRGKREKPKFVMHVAGRAFGM